MGAFSSKMIISIWRNFQKYGTFDLCDFPKKLIWGAFERCLRGFTTIKKMLKTSETKLMVFFNKEK